MTYSMLVMTTIAIAFRRMPTRTISWMASRCDPNTMALGGVATGSMNAHEAAIVAGTMRSIGGMPVTTLSEAMIGSSTCVVAVLKPQ